MNNLDKSSKTISTVLLGCIIIIISCYILYIIVNIINKLINKLISKYIETFRNGSSNNSKRHKMIQIYKNDDIPDPDENPNIEDNDPDSTISLDPDNEEYDQYNQYIKFGLQ